jgi:diphthamide biosynthesis enzyme Dph1/Dph2-like protein
MAKTLFIPAKSKHKIKLPDISGLPKNLALVYSIQFKDQAEKIKEKISKSKNLVLFAQVLGCTQLKAPKKAQAILLIGQGKFHAAGLAIENKIPVYIINSRKIEKITSQDIKKIEQKQKIAYLKYLNADKIGILVSAKPGQQNFKKALRLKKDQKSKDSYLFIANELNTNEFENFPQINSWINTACRRMDMNSTSIINMNILKD